MHCFIWSWMLQHLEICKDIYICFIKVATSGLFFLFLTWCLRLLRGCVGVASVGIFGHCNLGLSSRLLHHLCGTRLSLISSTRLSPFIKLIIYDLFNQHLQISLERLFPHVLLFRNILETFNLTRININRSRNLLYPVTFDKLLVKMQALLPIQMHIPEQALQTQCYNHTIIKLQGRTVRKSNFTLRQVMANNALINLCNWDLLGIA